MAVLVRDGFQCVYCGRRPPEVVLEADHIVPRAAGGSGVDTNLAAACRDCNGGKSDRAVTLTPREPLGLIRRQLGGSVRETGLRLDYFRWCSDTCPFCAATTMPAFLIDGDAREVELVYRCSIGHPWRAFWEPRVARIHADAVRWELSRLVPA